MSRYGIGIAAVVLLGTLMHAAESDAESGDIVVDKRNAIYWQDNMHSKKSSEDWDDAVLYCGKLELHGLKQWRLPTFDELFSIVDYRRYEPAILPVFSNTNEGTYWTSTDFAPTTSRAWTIDFRSGKTYYSLKTTNHAVRCVKDMDKTPAEKKKK